MSAPTSHDPLVVTTKDGVSWLRRAVTQDGRGLYAVTDSCKCPEYLMATLAELAEHGIAGQADAVPMPVGPGPLKPTVDADRAKAPWGRGEDGRPLLPMGAHWTDIPELVDRTLAGIRARVDQAQSGSWFVAPATETWRAPGTVCTRVDGYPRIVGQCTNMLPADLELVLHAHDDLGWLLDMVAKLRARVSELENPAAYPLAFPWAALMDHEDLTDFLDELAASAITHASSEVALTEVEATCGRWRLIAEAQYAHNTAPGPDVEAPYVSRLLPPRDAVCARPGCGHSGAEHHHGDAKCWAHLPKGHGDPIRLCVCEGFVAGPSVEVSADKLTQLLAPTQVLREDPHDGPLHHGWRLGRDLPETGGGS
jgi:hypothetical protein